MKASHDLFELIKSLEQTEKRYFKVYASFHIIGEKNNYVKLFEAIAKQNVYDEKKIIHLFRKEKFTKNFSVAKAYLYNLLLKSLRAYHSFNSPDLQIKEFLEYTEILYKKGLYKQSSKLLSKAKEISYEYEKYSLSLEVLNWEKKILNVESFSFTDETKWNVIIKNEEQTIENLINLNKYWDLYARMFMLVKKKGPSRNHRDLEQYNTIIKSAPLNNEKNTFSYNTNYLHYTTYINFFYSQGDFLNYYKYNKKLLKITESYPKQIKEEDGKYTAVLHNFLIGCVELKKFDEFYPALEKLRAMSTKKLTSQIKIFVLSYSLELGMYINTGEFENAKKAAHEVESALKKYQNKISAEYRMVFYYQLFYIYFGLDQFKKALSWLNKILNNTEDKNTIRSDIYSFAMILNLITQYELKNNYLLDYIIRSTYRFLYKKEKLYKFETIIMQFIRKKMTKINTKKEQAKAFKELKKEIEESISKDTFEKKALQYFDFISWLESKIEGRSFAEIVSKRTKK